MSTLLCFSDIDGIRTAVQDQKIKGKTVALVPTMGNLHAGHLRLVEDARRQCDWVVCSIFVNPMQFGPNEDLDAYPRTLEQDKSGLSDSGCNALFCPSTIEIYPEGLQAQTVVSVPELGMRHCGNRRPGHFDGVTTVVNKLFNICQPDAAFFGLKDYQQFLIIKKMVSDLLIPVSLTGVETVRDKDGLAISSRNNYLSQEQRKIAPVLYKTLQDIRSQLLSGDKQFNVLEQHGLESLRQAGLDPDYFAICNADTLEPARNQDFSLVILAAAFLGKARLIDNVRLSLKDT